jgi:hypothetical protein
MVICNLTLGEDITQNLTHVGTLNGILEEARFFKMTELSYKLSKYREILNNNTLKCGNTFLIVIIACLI